MGDIKVSMNFGLFVHWGIYAIPAFSPHRKTVKKEGVHNGSEWYLMRLKNTLLYRTVTREYHTEHFGDAEPEYMYTRYYSWITDFEMAAASWTPAEWIELAKMLGAQYLILTVKHHDGISLYPTKYSPNKTERDFVQEFVDVCRLNGIKVGLYYSLMEWTKLYSKGKVKIGKYVRDVMLPQLQEICVRYRPDILWTDGDWQHTATAWRSYEFLEWLNEFLPECTINNRWGKEFIVPASFVSKMYNTGQDRLLQGVGLWEHVNTIGNSWGYAANQLDSDYKSAGVIRSLKNEVISHGGRFTLNIGSKPDGSLDERELSVLKSLASAPAAPAPAPAPVKKIRLKPASEMPTDIVLKKIVIKIPKMTLRAYEK